MSTVQSRIRGAKAVAYANKEWLDDIDSKTDKGKARITEYIKGDNGLTWDWLDGEFPEIYINDQRFMWCGAFASRAYQDLLPKVRQQHLASTNRLVEWSEGNARRIPIDEVQPGDIITVGNATSRAGSHVAIVEEVLKDQGIVKSIEGNNFGLGPDGKKHQGVIKHQWKFPNPDMEERKWRIRFVIRPLEEDYSVPIPVEEIEKYTPSSKAPIIVGIVLATAVAGFVTWKVLKRKKGKAKKKR